MRLLIVTTVNNMMRDFLLPFARHYRALGWTVHGLARRDDTFAACAAAFDRLWGIGWSRNPWDVRNLLNVQCLRRIVSREAYHLVHVHTPIAAFVTRFALRDMRARGEFRLIYTAHGFHFHKGAPALQNAAFLAMEKLAGRWTDYLVVINHEDLGSRTTLPNCLSAGSGSLRCPDSGWIPQQQRTSSRRKKQSRRSDSSWGSPQLTGCF